VTGIAHIELGSSDFFVYGGVLQTREERTLKKKKINLLNSLNKSLNKSLENTLKKTRRS